MEYRRNLQVAAKAPAQGCLESIRMERLVKAASGAETFVTFIFIKCTVDLMLPPNLRPDETFKYQYQMENPIKSLESLALESPARDASSKTLSVISTIGNEMAELIPRTFNNREYLRRRGRIRREPLFRLGSRR